MDRRSLASLILLAAAGPTHAHHSIAGVYDGAKPHTVEGTVTEFQFVNPHPILVIDVATGTSTAAPWRLEMDNRFELAGIGMSAATFKPGDRVIASGSLHRTEPQRLYLRRLDRPADAFRYEQIGSRPVLTTAPAP
jgi:hypothetical protein